MAAWRGCASTANRLTASGADAINQMTESDARAALTRCCGCRRWVAEMMEARPFRDEAAMHTAAERIWWSLEAGDWRQAFTAHPRIGEQGKDAWSRDEQSGVNQAAEQTLRALADANRSYEQRFGHVFLICATGLSGDQMLEDLNRRLRNDATTELRVAAGEQVKITRLRLERLGAA